MVVSMTSFKATNSVLKITDENNSFSITIPGLWNSKSAEKTFEEQIKILGLKSQIDIELSVELVKKRDTFNRRLLFNQSGYF